MKKKILSILLASVLMLTALCGLSVGAEGETRTISVYSGTPDADFWVDVIDKATPGEIVIENADQLMGFAEASNMFNFSGYTIKLGADMVINKGDASKWADEAPEYMWTASSTWAHIFDGNFDGQGHIISGLYVMKNNYAGFFGYVNGESGAEHYIKNFSIINSYYETTTTSGNNRSGGVIGSIGCWTTTPSKWTVENVHVDVDMNCASGGTTAGGIVGDIQGVELTVKNCVFEGYIRGAKFIGGAVGSVCKTATDSQENVAKLTVENFKINADISVSDERAGGVVGVVNNGSSVISVKNSIIDVNITLNSNNTWGAKAGLLLGVVDGANTITVTDCFFGGSITDATNKNSAGLIGLMKTQKTVNSVTMNNILISVPSTSVKALIAWIAETVDATNVTFALTNVKYDSTVWNNDTLPDFEKTGAKGTFAGTDDVAVGAATADLKGVAVFDGWTAVTGEYPVPAVIKILPDINMDNYINGVATVPPADDNNDNNNNNNENNNENNNNSNENSNTDTKAPETSAPETKAPTADTSAEEKGGCGSTVGIAGVALITFASAAGIAVSKKRNRE